MNHDDRIAIYKAATRRLGLYIFLAELGSGTRYMMLGIGVSLLYSGDYAAAQLLLLIGIGVAASQLGKWFCSEAMRLTGDLRRAQVLMDRADPRGDAND